MLAIACHCGRGQARTPGRSIAGQRGRLPALDLSQPGPCIVGKQPSEVVDRLVEELMDQTLTKAERMARLRALVRSGDDVPDELLDQALRRLMERLTE